MNRTTDSDTELARSVYGDRIVDKRLAMQHVFARLPRYVTEYLLAKYVHPGHEDEDVAKLREQIRGRVPETDQKEVIKNRLMRDGEYTVIDQVEAEVDLAAGRHWARVNCLDNDRLAIHSALVDRYEGLLNGGLWGTCALSYRDTASPRDKITIVDFVPFQVTQADIDVYKAGRSHFTRNAWLRLLLRSAGYEPDAIPSERRRWLLLARLVPLVQRNVNLIELGPRGTGKTFLLRNLSPSVFTISGGRASPAALFLHKGTQRLGILGTRKVVVFDEVAATTFPDRETIATLKDFMESGQYSRGKKTVASDASILFTGNIEVTGDRPSAMYTHLFEELPAGLIDAAFLDRIHGYLPGWEIPKLHEQTLAQGAGFVTDYFGEVLRLLRDEDFSTALDAVRFEGQATIRDVRGARRIAEGMLKLLFPDRSFMEEDLRACLRFGAEMRQRVHNQLMHVAPGEYPNRSISFPGMAAHDAPDLEVIQRIHERDVRANREPLVGHVSALAVSQRGSAILGGGIFFIEASLVNGSSGFDVTGLRGRVLEDSIKTAHQLIQGLTGEWNLAAQRIRRERVALHLVNIAEPREGPSAGVAFVTAMVSALLHRPVRPGIALTGEISLQGAVEAVGGVPHKIAAAARHQRKAVIIPAQNAPMLAEIPDDILTAFDIHTVERIEEVLDLTLMPVTSASEPRSEPPDEVTPW